MDLLPIGPFPGIYVILCNDKKYIGSSLNINKRITDHKRELKNNTHHSYLLQTEFNICNKIDAWCIKQCLNNEVLFEEEQIFLDTEKPELNVSLIAQNNVPSKEYSNLKQGGERNHRALITIETAISIVKERLKGSTLKDISEKLNVSYHIVVSICSSNNWEMELMRVVPEEYSLMKSNKTSLGITNRKEFKPSNRLFNDVTLLDVLHRLLKGNTLTNIACTYNTSKAVISSIKRMHTYVEDTRRLLTKEELEIFLSKIR